MQHELSLRRQWLARVVRTWLSYTLHTGEGNPAQLNRGQKIVHQVHVGQNFLSGLRVGPKSSTTLNKKFYSRQKYRGLGSLSVRYTGRVSEIQ